MSFTSKFALCSLVALIPMSACAQSEHGHGGGVSFENTEAAVVRGKVFAARIVQWQRGPQVSEDISPESLSKCEIEITTLDGQVPAALSVETAYPYMKIHGHGAPSGQITRTLQGNRLTVDNIMFTMSGPWELRVKASVNGQTEELELPVVVR